MTLERLTKRLRNCAGGSMLDGIHTFCLEQGDAKAKDLYLHLLEKASQPFLAILSRWLFKGELNDPYKEFMISEDVSVSREALEEDFNALYWENRYTLRESHVPMMLKSHATRALTAGKYLNVIRGCAAGKKDNNASNVAGNGGSNIAGDDGLVSLSDSVALALAEKVQLPKEAALHLDPVGDNTSLPRIIDSAYAFSSRALLKLLEEGHGLSGHLRSLRRFFLLEHGDFFIQFMDAAEEELRRDVRDVSLPRIQGLLQLAVQTSTLSSDPHREDLTCTLASHNLIQHLHLIQSAGEGVPSDGYLSLATQGLKGVEALTLDYKVGWPVSIVLSRRAITKYQLLSRLLYFGKHVEARVLASWKDHQNTKELNVRAALGASYCLRHRMLHFLQNFVYYMALEVISPRSHQLQQGLLEAQDMDEVMGLHEKFLDSCLKECLLASQDLLKILTKIMTTCLLFADQMKRFTETTSLPTNANGAASNNSDRSSRVQSQATYIKQETSHDVFSRMLQKFSDTFDAQLKEFLERLWTDSYSHHPQLSNLCVRLDYNAFYTGRFGEC